MAECQGPYAYDETNTENIRSTLSEQRFQKYLDASGGNVEHAITLYLYNGRLAKSLLFPLGVTEVVVRNAVDEALVRQFNEEWHLDNIGRAAMRAGSVDALDKSLLKLQRSDRGRVVAELPFEFWTGLFHKHYSELWRTKANIVFPHLQRGEGRQELKNLLGEINGLRNRVAHHEPVIDANLSDLCAKMHRVVGWRSKSVAMWMKAHWTLDIALRSRPGADVPSSPVLSSRMDPKFAVMSPGAKLSDISRTAGGSVLPVVVTDNGAVKGAFTPQQFADFLVEKSTAADGYVALQDHTIGDLLASLKGAPSWQALPTEARMSEVTEALQVASTRMIVATDPASGAPLGVLLKAHRRY